MVFLCVFHACPWNHRHQGAARAAPGAIRHARVPDVLHVGRFHGGDCFDCAHGCGRVPASKCRKAAGQCVKSRRKGENWNEREWISETANFGSSELQNSILGTPCVQKRCSTGSKVWESHGVGDQDTVEAAAVAGPAGDLELFPYSHRVTDL